jgi:hypothetical protein
MHASDVHRSLLALVAIVAALGCKESGSDDDAGPACDPATCAAACQAMWSLTGICEGDRCVCVWPDTGTDPEADAAPTDMPDDGAEDVPVEMPVDACTNSSDQSIIDGTDVYGEAASCAMGCMSASDMIACVRPCLVDATGLSEACATCYAATVRCSFDNCLGECAMDPESAECQSCIEESGCQEEFEACSGITE